MRTWFKRRRHETPAQAELADAIVDNWIAQATGPKTIGELTPAELGVWVVIYANHRIMLGGRVERWEQRDYTGHLVELNVSGGTTWVKLLRFRGEADEETITRGFPSDTPIEVRR
jgi:hypothetical protein